jgi:hypothetical protein
MSFMFGSPKMPEISSVAPPVTPPAPSTSKEDETKRVEEEKKKIKKGREKRSTILTSERGILEQPPVQYKTLLGE